MKNTIRIAILGNNTKIDYWIYKMLEDVINNQQIEVVNYIQTLKIKQNYPYLFRIYNLFEEQIFKLNPDAFEKKDIQKLLPSTKIVAFNQNQGANEIQASLKNQNLDYIIKLDSSLPSFGLEKIVSGGILFLYHSNIKDPLTHTLSAREMLTNQDTIQTNLMYLSNNSELNVLKTIKVSADKMSIKRTANDLLWTSSMLVPRALEKFIDIGSNAYLKQAKKVYDFSFEDRSNAWKPKNMFLLASILRKYLKKLKQLLNSRFFTEQWMLLYSFKEYNPINGTSPKTFSKIIPPKDRFWADPFIYERNNQHYVFLEELIYNDIKGHISVMTINKDGTYTQPTCILKKDYHLSYPFLIEDNKQLYMIPETNENKTIDLYKCVKFPYEWEFVMNLMNNIVAVDTTILKKDNRYWMFTNIQESNGASKNNELFIFYSDNLLSQNWHPHAQNPIISDVTRARPAGNIFKFNKEFYRPSQNCGKHYGYAFSINRITELTEEKYEEQEVSSIIPDWDKNINSTHTINQLNDLTIIDGRMHKKK